MSELLPSLASLARALRGPLSFLRDDPEEIYRLMPELTQLLTDHSSWRASRALDKCNDTSTQTAQMALDLTTQYRCLYKARLTYSATLITRPAPTPGTQTDGT